MKTIDTIDTSPFKKLVMTIGELPTTFIESMSYYEALAWLVDYIKNTVIPAVNNNAEAVEELQKMFIELKSFVDNYFENLDVQEEIDHKLDEMAESGKLAEIVAQYLGLKSVFAFNTIADMAVAEYLRIDSVCRTLGKTNAMTGDGSYYKVRQRTNADQPDGVNLVVLINSENLVAEIVPDYASNTLQNEITTNVASINSQLNSKLNNVYQDPAYMHAFGVINAKPDGTNTYTMGGVSTTYNSDGSMKNIYVVTYCDATATNRLYNIVCGGTGNPSAWSYTYIDIPYAQVGGQLHGSSSCAVGDYFYIADLPNSNHSILKVNMTDSTNEYIDLTSFGFTKIGGCQWDGEKQQWLVKVNDTTTGMSTNYVFNSDFTQIVRQFTLKLGNSGSFWREQGYCFAEDKMFLLVTSLWYWETNMIVVDTYTGKQTQFVKLGISGEAEGISFTKGVIIVGCNSFLSSRTKSGQSWQGLLYGYIGSRDYTAFDMPTDFVGARGKLIFDYEKDAKLVLDLALNYNMSHADSEIFRYCGIGTDNNPYTSCLALMNDVIALGNIYSGVRLTFRSVGTNSATLDNFLKLDRLTSPRYVNFERASGSTQPNLEVYNEYFGPKVQLTGGASIGKMKIGLTEVIAYGGSGVTNTVGDLEITSSTLDLTAKINCTTRKYLDKNTYRSATARSNITASAGASVTDNNAILPA